ncbi:MAG: GAF domain-containing protein [Anaerolineae bacterium]|nr:GAF domain-containing protein [Anaerolineae bacterium]
MQKRVLLQNFSRELTEHLDLQFIFDRMLACVSDLVNPRCAVVLALEQGGHYEVVATRGGVNTGAISGLRFVRQDGVIARLQRGGDLLLRQQVAWQTGLDVDERARLDALGAVLLVPLRARDQLLGVLALGPLSSGGRYGSEELALLDTIADQTAIAAANARLYADQLAQSRYLIEQTRRLTDILSLGHQLKSLDRDQVVQSTVEAVRESLGFDLVTLSLIDDDNPMRVRVVAWSGVKSATWERLAQTTFPLLDFDALEGVRRLGQCYFAFALDSQAQISTEREPVSWQEGDQLYVPLTSSEGLIGYLTVDRPRDGYRPHESALEMLEILSNQAAVAIQNAILYDNIDRALDERLAELSTLQEIDRQINARLDFQHVMDTTLNWAMQITAATAGTLALVSDDHQFLRVVAHRGYPPEIDAYWEEPWPISEGIVGRVVRTGKHECVEDTTRDADYVDLLVSVRSQLAVPIERQDRVIGVISLESDRSGGFNADHIAFLRRLADHATIAIENAQLYDQAQLRVAELTTLQQISLDLTSSLDLNAVLDSVVRNAQVLFGADSISLYLYDAHREIVSFGAGITPKGKLVEPPMPPEDNKLISAVARSGEAMIIPDVQANPVFPLDHIPVGAIACVPLRVDSVLGVFNVVFEKRHLFTSDELLVIQLLANQAAIAIKNAQLYAAVQQANEAKSEFVSIVSHELKVPMTSIRGYARLMTMGATGELSGQQHEFMDVILNNVDRMTNLVSDLLDSARIQSGRIRLAPRSVALSKIVQDTLPSVRTEIEAREHELIVDLPVDLPNVQADPGWITQVLVNLLSNAYKYTPDGGQIKVWAQRRGGSDSAEGQWVMCAVADSGVGLREEDRERLFQQFFRVRDQKMQKETGTGLGLSITRSIVELHGGRIWVESTYGQGSTFYFTLPIAE